jgi:hypothetical protein
MARPYEDSNSAVKTRRQQEDQRRMAFRRAIEDRCEERQLLQSISDYPELACTRHQLRYSGSSSTGSSLSPPVASSMLTA